MPSGGLKCGTNMYDFTAFIAHWTEYEQIAVIIVMLIFRPRRL